MKSLFLFWNAFGVIYIFKLCFCFCFFVSGFLIKFLDLYVLISLLVGCLSSPPLQKWGTHCANEVWFLLSLHALGNCRWQISKRWIALLQIIRCLRLKLFKFHYLEGTLHLLVYQMVPALQGMSISVGLGKALNMRSLSFLYWIKYIGWNQRA